MAGFIKTNFDIKLVILYILSESKEPLSFDHLFLIAEENEGIDYFLLKQSVDELLEKNNIAFNLNLYSLTQRGQTNLSSYKDTVPLSVQKNCKNSLKKRNH